MKVTERWATRRNESRIAKSALRACVNGCRSIRDGIEHIKAKIHQQHAEMFRGQERLLQLALNEAEALAWQTDFPHLFFPELALEKAAAAVSWQQRQRGIHRLNETAFAA
jgi:hypothetical protein